MEKQKVSGQILEIIQKMFPDAEQPTSNQPYNNLPFIYGGLHVEQLKVLLDQQLENATNGFEYGDIDPETAYWGLYFQAKIFELMVSQREESN